MTRKHAFLVRGTLLLGLAACVDHEHALGPPAAITANLEVAGPTVVGPVPAVSLPGSAAHDYPFFSTTEALAVAGYVEEEFFIEGYAARYSLPALSTGAVLDDGHPYRTRIIVRRPASPNAFNGTVLMEWQNVTAAFDFDGLWISNHEHIMRRGYAWVGVSAQRSGITRLTTWSPARYGSLTVPTGEGFENDTLAYDIFSQAGRAVKHPTDVDPMGGLRVRRLLAVGISQSANRLVPYYNSIQPLAGVFDGFLVIGGGGLLRTDRDVKVFKVLSETDLNNQAQATWRQPPTDRLRRWEVAGAAHLDYYVFTDLTPLMVRDLGITPSLAACTDPPLGRIPYYYVLNAAIDHLARWVKNGVAPPVGPDILTTANGPPAVIVRDTYGNALGGIRLSQHAVPTAMNSGINAPMTSGWCRTVGSHVPFSPALLAELYPTHQYYLSLVIDSTHAAQRAGFILGHDAGETISMAARSDVGR